MVVNITVFLNDTFLENDSGLWVYAIIRIILTFFLTIITLYYNFYYYYESRSSENKSFIWISNTGMFANVIFSLTATAIDGIPMLFKNWYGEEILCQCVKVLQSCSLHLTCMVIVFILRDHIPSDTFKTQLCLLIFMICSAMSSVSEVSISVAMFCHQIKEPRIL